MRTYSRKFWMPSITVREGVFAFVYLWRIPATTLRERSERNLKTWGGCKMHENVKFTLQREVLVKNYELVQYSKRILHIINFLSTLMQCWYSEFPISSSAKNCCDIQRSFCIFIILRQRNQFQGWTMWFLVKFIFATEVSMKFTFKSSRSIATIGGISGSFMMKYKCSFILKIMDKG